MLKPKKLYQKSASWQQIVNKVNLKTGKKLDERKGTAVERTRQMNDEIAKKQGWQSDCPRA
ncbi:relaxase/mobilization nuclease domain-containing protein [Levilactobacillus brevis]